MRLRQRSTAYGFTLVELAVVLAIVALLLSTLMYTLAAQTDQRNFDESRRRLEHARELLLSYAVVNGRLPCPAICIDATCSAGGAESIVTPAGSGTGGTCTTYYNGYLPATTIGFAPSDSNGYALDAWGNRIRYAVSSTNAPHFTANVTLKTNGITTAPADIDICKHLTAANQVNCGATSNRVVTSGTVAAVMWSQGKNFASTAGAASIDEGSNHDNSAAFVSRTPTPSGASDGEFDDVLLWIPVGALYGRMVAAGVLP
jgi:prepilin-type N-terminal cleavage/methylation domain-containing protein